jgi:hypothetical protein
VHGPGEYRGTTNAEVGTARRKSFQEGIYDSNITAGGSNASKIAAAVIAEEYNPL